MLHRRAIRSYVVREGRITAAQQRALEELMPVFGVTRDALAGHGPARVFGRTAPLCLEIGCGDGENLAARAAADPRCNYLACEVHRPGLGHLLLQTRARGLDHLRVVQDDAMVLLETLAPDTLDLVYIFFPDPWPKVRHHKRRLVNPTFLDLLGARLRRSGRLYFATDDAHYAESVLDAVDAAEGWYNLAGPRALAPRPCFRIVTRFERRALEAGARVHDLALARS